MAGPDKVSKERGGGSRGSRSNRGGSTGGSRGGSRGTT